MALTAYIDLTEKNIKIMESPTNILKKYLGSRGYAAKILYDNVGPEVEPLSQENYLIFSTGPFTGTPWPTAARFTVTAKSPLTGVYGYANSSGFFGPELRKAGFDALVFKGKAQKPTILIIEENNLSLIDGEKYWGKTTEETERELKNIFEGCRVASIGPAGERLVKISSVINDYGRAAARCGMGAVMGFKNLKAIAVRASKNVPYSAEFKKVALEMMKKVGTHPASKSLRKWGTAQLIDPKNISGDLPTRNHQLVQFSKAEMVNAKSLSRYLEKNMGCFSCPIACSRFTKVEEGPYKCRTEGPEYETLAALGPLVGNANIEAIIYGNLLCNRLGIDTISTGVVIAFAMECHEKGLLSDDELNLEWGKEETIIELIKNIAYRKGLGDLLAEGVRRAAERIGGGAEKYAMHVKGLELPRQEPRICKGMALGHSTSNRGADHLYALPTIDLTGNVEVGNRFFPECMPKILERTDETYKPDMVVFTEAYCAISDALGVCKFSTTENFTLYPEDLSRGLKELLGYDYDGESLIKTGERIVNIERMYNYRHGLSRKDDQLPARFLKEAATVYDLETGEPLKKGLTVNLKYMLDRYYRLRNWDEDGIPTAGKLKELGLEELIKDLRNKI
ncbi:aldehyde ferredoxin oxidoreductase [Candidatus Atribacteria bacterium HGW-Atribacteria-1]|nr:MAG: aldehyde ferredoxin oxidoreductase [Candidatus Atribacteria bacterium HGW-Atribacteria-1]